MQGEKRNLGYKNETNKKREPSDKNLPSLQTSIRLAKEMGKMLG